MTLHLCPKDLSGLRFGRLTVIRRVTNSTSNGRGHKWECRCSCGETKVVLRRYLVTDRIRSCGCLLNESRGHNLRTHGLSYTPEFKTWVSMIERCKNTGRTWQVYHGARGIKVCDRWLVFENFLADMGHRPSPQHSIDRIDNDGDYTPDNCRWATPKQQSANTHRNVRFTYNGITMCLSEWERAVGLKRSSLSHRLTAGWTFERALTTPMLTRSQAATLTGRANKGRKRTR